MIITFLTNNPLFQGSSAGVTSTKLSGLSRRTGIFLRLRCLGSGFIRKPLLRGFLDAALIWFSFIAFLCASGCGVVEEKERLATLEREVMAARSLVGQAESIFEDLERSVMRLEEFEVYIPPSDRYAWAYEYVTRCAVQSRVTIDFFEEVQLDAAQGGDILGIPYEIRISTRCGYRDLINFLWRMEKGNPLLRISRVMISSEDDPMVHRVQVHVQWLRDL